MLTARCVRIGGTPTDGDVVALRPHTALFITAADVLVALWLANAAERGDAGARKPR